MEGGYRLGSRPSLVLIDTNVFVIDLRYRRDVNYKTNQRFLEYAAKRQIGFTTIVNLLELCAILSFNLNETQLTELWFYFQERYKIVVLPAPELNSSFPSITLSDIFGLLKKRTSLGDALMILVAQKHLPFVSTLVSWDKLHFNHIFPGTVLNPDEFLRAQNTTNG